MNRIFFPSRNFKRLFFPNMSVLIILMVTLWSAVQGLETLAAVRAELLISVYLVPRVYLQTEWLKVCAQCLFLCKMQVSFWKPPQNSMGGFTLLIGIAPSYLLRFLYGLCDESLSASLWKIELCEFLEVAVPFMVLMHKESHSHFMLVFSLMRGLLFYRSLREFWYLLQVNRSPKD